MIHGGAPAGWLEFSANLNPLGTPTDVSAAVARVSYDRYADLATSDAEAHLALDTGVARESVLLTAGATEAIRLVIAAFGRDRRTVILGPTYTEYARLAARSCTTAAEIRALPPSFEPPTAEALDAFGRGPCLLFVCDPNNPTGRAIGGEQLRRLAAAVPVHSLLVLDQSFAPFAASTSSASELLSRGRVVLVRSLTKRLAAPGLRVGYVIGAPAAIATLRRLQDPWSVGAHAIAAAGTAKWELKGEECERIASWRVRLARGLEDRGFGVVPSEANFLLARVGPEAPRLVHALALRRIAVRECTSFALPEHLRLAVRPPDEQDVLLEAIAAIGVRA